MSTDTGHGAALTVPFLIEIWLIILKKNGPVKINYILVGLGFSLFSIFTFRQTKGTLNENCISAITSQKHTFLH